jgi:hypothetical protein
MFWNTEKRINSRKWKNGWTRGRKLEMGLWMNLGIWIMSESEKYINWPIFLVTFHPILGFPKVLHILHKLAPEKVPHNETKKVVMLFLFNF